MAITDIFKKENTKGSKTNKQAKAGKAVAAVDKDGTVKAAFKNDWVAFVLEHAHITEKASNLAEINQYVFKVALTANKQEIARAIEGYYGVSVDGVNIVNIPAKKHRRGKGITTRPAYRKAIVSVKKGQTIEVMPK